MRYLLTILLLSVSFNTAAGESWQPNDRAELIDVLVSQDKRIRELGRVVEMLAAGVKNHKTGVDHLNRVVKRLNNTSVESQVNLHALNLAVRNLRDPSVTVPPEALEVLERNLLEGWTLEETK